MFLRTFKYETTHNRGMNYHWILSRVTKLSSKEIKKVIDAQKEEQTKE